MIQENSNQKRRWLKRILSVGAPNALWLAPALLTPIVLTSSTMPAAWGQTPTATRSISDGQATVNAGFIIGWLNHSAEKAQAGDAIAAAKGFAEALRGRKVLGASDPQVEARLKEVEQILLGKGLKPEQIIEASKSLGAMSELRGAPSVAGNNGSSPLDRRDQVAALTEAAARALQSGDRAKAAELVARAEQSAVPDQWMLPGQITITQIKAQLSGVLPASASQPVIAANNVGASSSANVAPGVFQPAFDQTKTQPASSQVQLAVPSQLGENSSGDELYRRGVELLSQGDREAAYESFLRAWRVQGEMDPALRNQLKDKLSSMQSGSNNSAENVAASPINQVSEVELATRQRMMSEITSEIAAAEANRELEPELVAERLQTLRTRVSQVELDSEVRKRMLTIVDRAVTAHQFYMTQNRAEIDQNLKNRQIIDRLAMNEEERFKLDTQIASLVETYNDLMDKGDFMEAEAVAKQVHTLDRNSMIASLLMSNARNARRIGEYETIRTSKENGFIDAMLDVDMAATPMSDRDPLVFGDAKRWEELTKRRQAAQQRESERGMSPAETAIWEKLKQPVMVDFKARPLSEVARTLSDMTGVLIHIDQAGLALEGLTPDMQVTLSLASQISLRSALSLLLNTQNLDFQVRNEVLMITSARNTAKANVERVYSVKDLVIPIPNFVTDYNSGMAGALRQAYETVNSGLVARTQNTPAGINGGSNMQYASLDPNAAVLGQFNNMPGGSFGPVPGGMMGGAPMAMGSPGSVGGGGSMADFASLIQLIQSTVDPESWLDTGTGTSSIQPYPSNLSLVVSAPQTTHEKIADLLDSLRRLQDLQITIEVKFITLNDNFFERIGVDFDLRIDDNVRQLPNDDQGPSTVVGLSTASTALNPFPFTADFDVAMTQDSFGSAVPAFGGFAADAGASLGFAILSDLEMFFFLNAAQGDQRTNVLQAPRVTMFDGQAASINDTISRPFVTSLIPVVADNSVAQQPVIVVLNEGTVLNVQAVVDQSKRFVRLTLNPSFSQIDRVDTFTFEGSRTTRSGSTRSGTNILNPGGTVDDEDEDSEDIISGTTVQQPSFANTSVSTTVSVPDGGTILLGGIKRMREGRLERGVPILSKIPYVNRLFKNTAIGRETSTLMMTVTPRIIIQEEEEQKYGVNP